MLVYAMPRYFVGDTDAGLCISSWDNSIGLDADCTNLETRHAKLTHQSLLANFSVPPPSLLRCRPRG